MKKKKISHVRKIENNFTVHSNRNLKVNKNETKAISSSAYIIMKDATKAKIEIYFIRVLSFLWAYNHITLSDRTFFFWANNNIGNAGIYLFS